MTRALILLLAVCGTAVAEPNWPDAKDGRGSGNGGDVRFGDGPPVTLGNTSFSGGRPAPSVPHAHGGSLIFLLPGGKEALRIWPDGRFTVRGKTVTVDAEAYDAFQLWLCSAIKDRCKGGA